VLCYSSSENPWVNGNRAKSKDHCRRCCNHDLRHVRETWQEAPAIALDSPRTLSLDTHVCTKGQSKSWNMIQLEQVNRQQSVFFIILKYHGNDCKKGNALGVIELKTSCDNSVQSDMKK